LHKQLENAKEEMERPFPQARELEEKAARLAELDILLNMDNREQPQQENAAPISEQEEHEEPLEQEETNTPEATEQEQENGADLSAPISSPEVGQRVVFCPYEGQVKLTGEVVEVSDTTVTLRAGRVAIPVIRDRGIFIEAPVSDKTETLEYAREVALQYTGTDGVIFVAGGEGVYNGPVVEMTPAFAIQQTGTNVTVLHRLKDLEGKGELRQGENISIRKDSSGISITSARRGEERNENERERNGYYR
jgi:hypothetical protein